MRLHRLQVEAFGPFAEPLDLDLDAVADNGLFLLTGPTGAGKSSILDALTFALFHDVPGERAAARSLHSDHADPSTPPRVRLEFSLDNRRFLVERTPAWDRPKLRGTGTTRQHATAVLSEVVAGTWRTLSTRVEEANRTLTDLLGLDADQFNQVVLLPQGRFEAFLGASSRERQQLLQHLFATGVHEQVERWLRDRRNALAVQETRLGEQALRLAGRVSEASGVTVPSHDPTTPAGLADWAVSLAGTTRADWATASTARDHSTAEADRARDELDQTLVVHRGRTAGLDAGRQLAELDAHSDEFDRLRRRITHAERFGVLGPLRAPVLTARNEATRLEADLLAAGAGLARLLGGCDVPSVDLLADGEELLADVRDWCAGTERLAVEGRDLADRRDALELERAQWRSEQRTHTSEAAGLDPRAARVTTRLESARAAVGAVGGLTGRVAEAEERAAASTRVPALAAQVERLTAERSEQEAERLDLKEAWLDLRERRLSGIAAELAVHLAVGDACPVCGSADHPRPAVSGPEQVTAEAEKKARRRSEDAEARSLLTDQALRDQRSLLATAVARSAGLDPGAAAEALAVARAELTAARALADDLPAAEAQARSLALARERVGAAAAVLAERDKHLTAHEADLTGRVRDHEHAWASHRAAALDWLPGDVSDPTAAAHSLAADLATALDAYRHARTGHDTAAQLVEEREQALTAAAGAVGWSLAEALEADLPDDGELTAARAAVTAYDEARTRARLVLDDPDVVDALTRDPVDVDAARARAQQCSELAARHTAAAAQAERVATRVGALAGELAELRQAWQPVSEELATVTSVATLVDGSSPDNQLRMRLSSFVLQRRFASVVAAANARLGLMSDSRHQLEHVSEPGAGERRGGLGLAVLDTWTGTSRDPATLSGGERFVVSLALALGLADVVSAEAGGRILETLFVDEGFGALDADTLDDVMDTLDGLRQGGRVVGVVSHVPAMRDRIAAQVRVSKSRSGSTARVHTG